MAIFESNIGSACVSRGIKEKKNCQKSETQAFVSNVREVKYLKEQNVVNMTDVRRNQKSSPLVRHRERGVLLRFLI